MNLLPFALLLAASSRIVLDEVIEVPRAEWRYVELTAVEPKAVVNCEFEVVSGDVEVRVIWIARKDLASFRGGRQERIILASPFAPGGKLRHFAPEAGDYAMVVENQPDGRARAKVKMKVWVESAVAPRYASSERRLAVILLSCIVFLGIVSFSAYKLRDRIT